MPTKLETSGDFELEITDDSIVADVRLAKADDTEEQQPAGHLVYFQHSRLVRDPLRFVYSGRRLLMGRNRNPAVFDTEERAKEVAAELLAAIPDGIMGEIEAGPVRIDPSHDEQKRNDA